MAKLDINTKIKLNSGHEIPQLGYGTSIIATSTDPLNRCIFALLTRNLIIIAVTIAPLGFPGNQANTYDRRISNVCTLHSITID